LFLKANTKSDRYHSLSFKNGIAACSLSLLFFCACTFFETTERNQQSTQITPISSGIQNAFNPPGQITLSENVHSIQLYRKSSTSAAPIIKLNSSEQLQLKFETLGFGSRQFQVRFTHHNPDWSDSGLAPDLFMDGFQTDYISGGQASREAQPSYRQFSFDFPNQDFTFTFSGNYMLHVEDSNNGNLLFAIPFFIYENEGSVISGVETQVTPRRNLRSSHRTISRYYLPEEITQPQFDLEFYFVQNRFWGRMKRAVELDFSAPNHVLFETSSRNTFIGDYEFRRLSFRDITQTEQQISEIDLSSTLPLIILNDDVEGFSEIHTLSSTGRVGAPDYSLNARYANVVFRFDHQQNLSENAEIYLVGDFNQWAIQSGNRLNYSESLDRWETSAIVKAGSYHYKYVVFENNRIDDLIFDDRFSTGRQEYHAMVYKRDQSTRVYRLLQINHFFADP
jgi:hypothetical protein